MRVVSLPNGWRKAIIDLSDRPGRDEAWQQAERARNPEYAREYELVWGSRGGDPVYDGYRRTTHERELAPITGRQVLRGWDFGYRHPAVVLAQFDSAGRLLLLGELLGEDETIDVFGRRVQALTLAAFGRPDVLEDYGDPAGNQRSDRAERTSIGVLRDVIGARVHSRPSQIKEGLDMIRWALAVRGDGAPGLYVDPVRCPLVARGFAAGYIRDEKDPEKPLKDGYFEHLFDALRYLAIGVLWSPRRTREEPQAGSPMDARVARLRASKPAGRGEQSPVGLS